MRNQDTFRVVDQFGQVFEKQLDKGKYKDVPNNPTRPDGSIHEYCPPEHVAAEMDRLIEIHQDLAAPVEVSAAWLHHRFTQIHPFSDGNGRVARALASLVFIKASWFPLIVKREDRARYIDALEKADEEDLQPLVATFVEAQRNAMIQATEAAYDVKPIATADDAIAAVRDRLIQRGGLPSYDLKATQRLGEKLCSHAKRRLTQVADKLYMEIGSYNHYYLFRAAHGPLGVVSLTLATVRSANLQISYRVIGAGLVSIASTLLLEGVDATPINGTFQTNSEEDFDAAQARFTPWLERVIIEGLNAWRQTL